MKASLLTLLLCSTLRAAIPTTVPAWDELPLPVFTSTTKPTTQPARLIKTGVNLVLEGGKTYAVSETINMASNSGITVVGAENATLRWTGGSNATMVRISGKNNVWLSKLSFDGGGKKPVAIRFNTDSLSITDCGGYADLSSFILCEGAPQFAPVSHHIRILRCWTFRGAVVSYCVGTFRQGTSAVAVVDLVVEKCWFEGSLSEHAIRTHAVEGYWCLDNDIWGGVAMNANGTEGKMLGTINDRDGQNHYLAYNRLHGRGGMYVGPLDFTPDAFLTSVLFYRNKLDGLDIAQILPGTTDIAVLESEFFPRRNNPLAVNGPAANKLLPSGIMVGNRWEGPKGIGGDLSGFYQYDNRSK